MSERRRFFPSKTVQQVPGQKVEVEVEIKKGREAHCAPTGFFFSSQQALVRSVSSWSGNNIFLSWCANYEEFVVEYDANWNATYTRLENAVVLLPDNALDYQNSEVVEVIRRSSVIISPIGPACGIEWSMSWENGYAPKRYIEFSQIGASASFHASTIRDEQGGSVYEFMESAAILTATCGGKAVGSSRIILKPDDLV